MFNLIKIPETPPNINHLKKVSESVRDMCATTERIKAEEQRYREKIGYVPNPTWLH